MPMIRPRSFCGVEADLPGARVYTLRGAVVQTDEFVTTLDRVVREAHGSEARDAVSRLIRATGKPLPMAYDLDDSALVRDLGEPPRTTLESGISETLAIFERLHREGRL